MTTSQAYGGEAPGVQTQPNVRWRIVSSYSRSLDTLYGVAEGIGRRVEALTDGRFQIRAYPAGELVPRTQVLGAVQAGTVEMGHTAGYYYVGSNPASAFDTCVPFGLTGWLVGERPKRRALALPQPPDGAFEGTLQFLDRTIDGLL